MLDVVPKIITELRAASAVAAIADARVRGYEPDAPVISPTTGAVTRDGDARGPGQYIAFVVVILLAAPRYPTIPVQRARVALRAYGRDLVEASALWGACSDALHFRGPRIASNGLAIYQSHDETGGAPDRDPDTGQPYYSGVFDVIASTQPAT